MIQIIESSDIKFSKETLGLWSLLREQQSALWRSGLVDSGIHLEAASNKDKRQLWLRSMQAEGEMLAVLDLVAGSKHVLEVGVGWGATHFLIKQVTNNVMSIDKKFYLLAALSICLAQNGELDGSFLILGPSDSSAAVKQVQRILTGEKLDALYIDGDHKYEGVKADHELYSPLVKHNGIVLFHDYFHEVGAYKVVNEISETHTVNVVVDERHPCGTAWYYKDETMASDYPMREINQEDYDKYSARGVREERCG